MNRIAIMGIDPGRTTGVAACYLEGEATLKETLLGAESKKAIEVSGGWLDQARELSGLMWRFRYTANVEAGIALGDIHICVEDFVLRMPATTTDLTSCWVGAGAVARYGEGGEDVAWQQPSAAKRFATNERLKLWGLYEVGSEHKRDAWRHVALRANGLLG